MRIVRAALCASVAALCALSPAVAQAGPFKRGGNDVANAKEPPPPCTEDCWQLSRMTLHGAVGGPMTFEIKGSVRVDEEQKIPLFGPPSQLRLDDLSMDGGRPTVTFDTERYYLITRAKSFTLRGKLTLGSDPMISVIGPLLSLDAPLTKGRLVEGERLSGLSATVLHFDPMSEDANPPAKPRQPPVFRLSRAVRFGTEAGAMKIPASSYPIATSNMEVTVGLPESLHPIAVLGGDRARWALSRGDLLALALGIGVACFGFRTRKTRLLGALVTAGLWFVSREGFVFASGGLFVVGAIFLASRFIGGLRLLIASGALLVAALFGGRWALTDSVTEPAREMFVEHPQVPSPEMTHAAVAPDGSLDTKEGITPVSLSLPTSERYVQSSRQLITKDRPFAMRIIYVTSNLVTGLHLGWLFMVGLLFLSHRDRLERLRSRFMERLTRRPDATAAPVADAASPF